MYNPATQVQVSTDANLGSYFQKNKIAVGTSPTAFPFKKKKHNKNKYFLHAKQHDKNLSKSATSCKVVRTTLHVRASTT
jgi:hypothetical protein